MRACTDCGETGKRRKSDDMYAIIEAGGKQLKVEKGDKVKVEKINAEVGSEVSFDVLLTAAGKTVKVGKPYVKGVKATGLCDIIPLAIAYLNKLLNIVRKSSYWRGVDSFITCIRSLVRILEMPVFLNPTGSF